MAIGSNDFLCSEPSKAAIKAPRSSKIDKSEIKKSSTLGFTLSWKKERQFLTLLFTPWKIVTDFFQLKIIVPNEVKQCLCFLRHYEKMKDNKNQGVIEVRSLKKRLLSHLDSFICIFLLSDSSKHLALFRLVVTKRRQHSSFQ